jgi:hypothetical protein
MWSVNILRLNFYEGREGDWHLKCALDLKSFAVDKFPEDATLVPKHVGVICHLM